MIESNRNSANPGDMKMTYLETGLEPSDLILDCFQGHIALMDFHELARIARGQPDGLTKAFRSKIHELLEKETAQWETDELIKIKTGWASSQLLLIGFKYEASHQLAYKRIGALASRFARVNRLSYPDADGMSTHEVHLAPVIPIFSMVTKPRLTHYQYLAVTLINDLQRQKPSRTSPSSGRFAGVRSAMWLTNPAKAISSPTTSSSERQESYKESTRRLLRRSFRSRKIHLEGRPALNPVTGAVDSVNASLMALDTSAKGSGLAGETAETLCASLGITWELDTALIEQALHDATHHMDESLAGQIRLGVPVHAETILSWATFPEDLSDVLSSFPDSIVRCIRLYVKQEHPGREHLNQSEIARINEWTRFMRAEKGMEIYLDWENLSQPDNAGGLGRPFGGLDADGIRLCENMIETTEAHDLVRSAMKQKHQIAPNLALLLSGNATPGTCRLADQVGASAVEQPLRSVDKSLNHALASIDADRAETIGRSALVDARSRFLAISETYLSRTHHSGAGK